VPSYPARYVFAVQGYWHNYKTTCGYADGHIELKKLGQTLTPACEWDTVPTVYDEQTDPNDTGMPSYHK
jgi:hypothetical protein